MSYAHSLKKKSHMTRMFIYPLQRTVRVCFMLLDYNGLKGKMGFSWKAVGLFLAVFLMVANATFVGGPIDANLNDPGVKDALQMAVSEHNKRSNDVYLREVSSVIKAQKQVVSGVKYIFRVNLGRTACRKDGSESSCPVHTDVDQAKAYVCTFEVWSQLWLGSIKLIKDDCEP